MLPPSVIAGASVVCAAGAWLVAEPVVLRALAGGAAAAAVVGSVMMRRWDRVAGRRVAELIRARAGDEWRFDERVAEVEGDLEESRELRGKLEQRLRAKRSELASLRNEHAALLRRYATAETERATALEGRRRLAIEAAAPAKELPAAEGTGTDSDSDDTSGDTGATEAVPPLAPLYARANAALERLGRPPGTEDDGPGKGTPGAGDKGVDADKGAHNAKGDKGGRGEKSGKGDGSGKGAVAKSLASKGGSPKTRAADTQHADAQHTDAQHTDVPQTDTPQAADIQAADTQADAHERTAASPPRAGHFNVPTAAAVVAPAPTRRRSVEGGFDFFGTKGEPQPAALEAVRNQDLADVVGEEALAVHKAEAESEFKPSSDAERGIGQVIDLTAHDETEPIDVEGLRSALQA
ncbi:hypothetical protein ACFVT5_26365 [Streptomyces sp. NPDC058001]|uniref:hypothetical protein n=1 Tax=Streptomyces sp. NPDC058001 TaxID=3346300 RepID=UPI0036E9F90F